MSKKQLELTTKHTKYVYPDHIEPSQELNDLVLVLNADLELQEQIKTAQTADDGFLVPLIEEFGVDPVNYACWLVKTGNLANVLKTGE